MADQPTDADMDAKLEAAQSEAVSSTIDFTWHDHDFSFARKRFSAYQASRIIRRDGVFEAYRWIVGEDQFDQMIDREADEDGVTPNTVVFEFIKAVDKAAGVKNS